MISSRVNRREFCYAALLAVMPAVDEKLNLGLPEPEFQIGDRVRTERVCDDYRSPNYLGIDWESGFVVGYCWQYDEWRLKPYRQGWTYWIRFDKTNYETYGDRRWLDFVHESEIIQV